MPVPTAVPSRGNTVCVFPLPASFLVPCFRPSSWKGRLFVQHGMPYNGLSFNQRTHDHIHYLARHMNNVWIGCTKLGSKVRTGQSVDCPNPNLGMLLRLPTVPTNTGLELCIANLCIVPSAHPHNIKCVRVSVDQTMAHCEAFDA